MHDVPRPEAPVIVVCTRDEYEMARRRIRELSQADRHSSEYLELVALRAAIARWDSHAHAAASAG